MQRDPETSRHSLRGDLLLALAVLVAFGYFWGGASWNQNARLNPIYTFVEPGPDSRTFRMDRFLPAPERGVNTGDWSLHDGHYYSNKAPGTILLGVLGYLPLHALETQLGLSVDRPEVEIANAYLINLWVSVLPLALAALAYSRLLAGLGVQAGRARLLTAALFFGTALFPYATQTWGHTTAAAFTCLALWACVRSGRGGMILAGLFAGLAVICDFLALPLAAGLLIWAAFTRRGAALWMVAGGTGPLLVLLGYNALCFGSPLALPTDAAHPEFREAGLAFGMFSAPSLRALVATSVGLDRGLFVQMPVLLLALWGFGLWARRSPRDPLLWLCLLVPLCVWGLVASFVGWHGGATVCARYLIPVLPLLWLGAKEVPATRTAQTCLVASLAASVLNMLAVAAVSPVVEEGTRHPLYGLTWSRFLAGELHPYLLPTRLQAIDPTLDAWKHLTVWNWGELLGLSGWASLAPLLLVLAGLALLAASRRRRVATPS